MPETAQALARERDELRTEVERLRRDHTVLLDLVTRLDDDPTVQWNREHDKLHDLYLKTRPYARGKSGQVWVANSKAEGGVEWVDPPSPYLAGEPRGKPS